LPEIALTFYNPLKSSNVAALSASIRLRQQQGALPSSQGLAVVDLKCTMNGREYDELFSNQIDSISILKL
jgi:hypothetical protein